MEFELDAHQLEPWTPRGDADREPALSRKIGAARVPHSGLTKKPQQAILIPEEDDIPEQAFG